MPAPSHPPGRTNGLPSAASYVALVDVDPPVADHVLTLLSTAGIAAVAEPLVGEVGPYRDVRRPDRPTDRIHVDRERVVAARAILTSALPPLRADFHADAAHRRDLADMDDRGVADGPSDREGPGAEAWRPAPEDPGDEGDGPATDPADELADADVEAEFARIVSAYGPTPALPDVRHDPPSGLSSRLVRRGDPEPPEEPDPSYWPDDHFVPPTPPRGPRLTRPTKLAWLGAVGGPLLVLAVMLLNLPYRQLGMLIGIGAFVAGFATLVARLPNERDDDDGAIV